MSWVDYSRYAQGYWIRNARLLEGHRMTAYTLLMVNRVKGKSLPPMSRIWPLCTDTEPEVKPAPTKEQFKAIANRYLKKWPAKKV
jgi:hypothetical protein